MSLFDSCLILAAPIDGPVRDVVRVVLAETGQLKSNSVE